MEQILRGQLGSESDAGFGWVELGQQCSEMVEYSYYPGLDRLHAHIRNDSLFLAHSDATGSVIALTDVALGVRRTFAYNDWGLSTGGVDNGNFGSAARAQWKGALRTGLTSGGGLFYMRNRWYDPRSGRFLSEDPIGLTGGLNLYRFAENDPIGASDPTGLTSAAVRRRFPVTAGLPWGIQQSPLDGGIPWWERNIYNPEDVGGANEVGAPPKPRPGGGGAPQPQSSPPSRTTLQCFRENTAPVTDLIASSTSKVAAASATVIDATFVVSGWLMTRVGSTLRLAGTVELDLFLFGRGQGAQMLDRGLNAISVGRGYISTGSALLSAGVRGIQYGGVALAGGAAYYGTSYGLCAIDSEY